jgi:hypothetical protein
MKKKILPVKNFEVKISGESIFFPLVVITYVERELSYLHKISLD